MGFFSLKSTTEIWAGGSAGMGVGGGDTLETKLACIFLLQTILCLGSLQDRQTFSKLKEKNSENEDPRPSPDRAKIS